MRRYLLLINFAFWGVTSAHAAIFTINDEMEVSKFGQQEIFDEVRSLRVYAQTQHSSQWRQCSAVRVESHPGFAIYVTAAHCLSHMSKAFLGDEPIYAYFIDPLYDLDPRRDIGAFAVKGASSKLGYPIGSADKSELLQTPLIYSGYSMSHKAPLRQAGYISVIQIEDDIRVEFKGRSEGNLIPIHPTLDAEGGGGIFVEDKQGRLTQQVLLLKLHFCHPLVFLLTKFF